MYRAIELGYAGHTDRYDWDTDYMNHCIRRETPRILLMTDGSKADEAFCDGPRR